MVEIKHNAHKLVYLMKMYPEKNLLEVMKLMQIPEIDLNTAIWWAEEAGILKKVETGMEIVKEPETWEFGEDMDQLRNRLEYGFTQLGKMEQDFEEYSLQRWLEGYPLRDRLMVLPWLIEIGVMAEYTITDEVQGDGSEYTFYTLAKNRDQEWGRKQFKSKPKSEAKDGKPAAEPEDENKETVH